MPLVSDGLLFGALTEKQKNSVLDRVAEVAQERFQSYFDAVVGAFDFRDLKTQFEKIALYRSRHPQEWALIKQQDPKEYQKQMQQWVQYERLNQFIRTHPRQSEAQTSNQQVSYPSNVTGSVNG